MIINKKQRESKTQLAKKLGVSRSSLYYKAKKEEQDLEMKIQILVVLGIHPSYGHKRIALEFPLNNKRIRRCMKKFGIKPYRRRAKKPRKKEDEGKDTTRWKNEIIGLCQVSNSLDSYSHLL